METLYSVEQAAQKLGGISKWTIHAWLSSGKLRRTKVGSRTMIRESELLKLLEEGEKPPTRRSRKTEGTRALFTSSSPGEKV